MVDGARDGGLELYELYALDKWSSVVQVELLNVEGAVECRKVTTGWLRVLLSWW